MGGEGEGEVVNDGKGDDVFYFYKWVRRGVAKWPGLKVLQNSGREVDWGDLNLRDVFILRRRFTI